MSLAPEDLAAFVRARAAPAPVPFVPEVRLWQAAEVTPLWHATSALAGWDGSPWWAFPWAGGQALARHLLDAPALVAGRRVFDFGTGSGLVAIAAARAGAARVVACDVDPFCAAVVPMNAALNGVAVELVLRDALGEALREFDVVLAGDPFYEQPLARRAAEWLGALARSGLRVLAGDGSRRYPPSDGYAVRASHSVPAAGDVEGTPFVTARVIELV